VTSCDVVGEQSASSLTVPSISHSRHSTVQESHVSSDVSRGRTMCDRPDLDRERPEPDEDLSDVENEVITKLEHNETMKQGARYDL